jgi:hypothetical protein
MLQNLEFLFSPRERIGVTATQGKFGAQSCGLVELRNRASSQSILSCSFSNNLCLLAHIHSFRSHASVVLLYPYTDDDAREILLRWKTGTALWRPAGDAPPRASPPPRPPLPPLPQRPWPSPASCRLPRRRSRRDLFPRYSSPPLRALVQIWRSIRRLRRRRSRCGCRPLASLCRKPSCSKIPTGCHLGALRTGSMLEEGGQV